MVQSSLGNHTTTTLYKKYISQWKERKSWGTQSENSSWCTPCIRVGWHFQTRVIWKHLYVEAAVQKDFAQKPIFWRVNFKHKIPYLWNKHDLEKVEEVLPPLKLKINHQMPHPFQKSAPILQGLQFEWPKLVDNSYLSLYYGVIFVSGPKIT